MYKEPIYKLQNISNEKFAFEGVALDPGEISHNLPLETYQRLLALYYGRILLPVEDKPIEVLVEEHPAVVIDVPASEIDGKEVVTEEPKPFLCDQCTKGFPSAKGLSAHKRFGHKIK